MKELLLHSRKSPGLVTLLDDDFYDFLMLHHSHVRWNPAFDTRTTYVTSKGTRRAPKTLCLHRLILGAQAWDGTNLLPGIEVDHIDHDGLNNLRSNLRLATKSQNMANQQARSNCTSQYKGVHWDKYNHKWFAMAKMNTVAHYLGRFDSEIAAAQAYNAFLLRHHGEFALVNKLPSKGA